MSAHIKDSEKSHWVNRAPLGFRPYLQLSRLDRPIGYWLLALPGWIGLAFAALSHGFATSDLKWAALVLIGAIAMRGAGCTYNDIVDQDLDAKVERTALRPLPAKTVTTKQAWIWLIAQCGIGLIVLLFMPRLAQLIALGAIPLVVAYPFMKRITWWPQVWLGFTFNWAVLVAYAAKTGEISPAVLILYAGLIFWTIGYDTIYACQDIEDDMLIGVKSTARRFGEKIKLGISFCYLTFVGLAGLATHEAIYMKYIRSDSEWYAVPQEIFPVFFLPVLLSIIWQVTTFKPKNSALSLLIFKFNWLTAALLILGFIFLRFKLETAWIPKFIPPNM